MTDTPRTLRYGTTEVALAADPERPFLDVLRGALGVRSAARGCVDGTCGACRVLVDGALVASCRMRWSDVKEGVTVETYETLATDPAASRAVNAFEEERPTRCRMCVAALGVTAVAIARAKGGRDEGREEAVACALREATCMCTGRGSWRRALSK
jgi:aerobic-type carbon monoxide dehydrogenase small subunit (CoxS/CutS family)